MHVPVAVLTGSNHHQRRICKHVRGLKQKSGLSNFNTVSCEHCNKDRSLWFAPIVSGLVAMSTEYFII